MTLGGEHPIQHTDDILYNCTPETYIIFINKCDPSKCNKKFLKRHITVYLLSSPQPDAVLRATMFIPPPVYSSRAHKS